MMPPRESGAKPENGVCGSNGQRGGRDGWQKRSFRECPLFRVEFHRLPGAMT